MECCFVYPLSSYVLNLGGAWILKEENKFFPKTAIVAELAKSVFSPNPCSSVSLLLSSLHLKLRTFQSWGFITWRKPSEASVIGNQVSFSSCWVFFLSHVFISSSLSFCHIISASACCSSFKNFSVMYSTVFSSSSKGSLG
jgi:hypothetical protein